MFLVVLFGVYAFMAGLSSLLTARLCRVGKQSHRVLPPVLPMSLVQFLRARSVSS